MSSNTSNGIENDKLLAGESASAESDLKDSPKDALSDFRRQWQRELQVSPKRGLFAGTERQESVNNAEVEDDFEKAKILFLSGAENERSGKLYEAIQFYRRAVQLVPDIEFRLYETTKTKPKDKYSADDIEEMVGSSTVDDSNSTEEEDDADEDEELLIRLQRIVGRYHCTCFAQHEQKSTHICSLPMEIILYVFRWVVSSDLDLRSLEMCSRVCRGFYVCSRDPEIWRLACARVWGVNCGLLPDPYASWRDMFLERPRLHFNGCYISKTTYVRHGENSFQDQFYRPWHLVEYYRYLRFFPEGLVLMLTTADEPVQSVSHLRYRSPRNPSVLCGHYRLRDDCITLVVHRQESIKQTQNYRSRGRRREVQNDSSEQTFHLELRVQNVQKRRHAQLSWLRYSIFTKNRNGTESNSTFDLAGSRFPPLWFSRVKSYTAESDSPLQ